MSSTPNDDGCPAQSCFPHAATIPPIAPGASATTIFLAPGREGLYPFRSTANGNTLAGQFHVD